MPAIAAAQHELAVELRSQLSHRRIGAGFRLLAENRRLFEGLSPERPGSGVLLGYLAQWVDAGFDAAALVKELLLRFPRESRLHLPVIDYLHLRLAEAQAAMAEENFEAALAHLQFVASIEEELRDNELLAIAAYWTGRCLRRLGRYDDALGFTIRGRDLAAALGLDEMAAVMRINESWLMFQKGRLTEAAGVLDEVRAVVAETDDCVSLGNIWSASGRIARRQGRNERALEHFAAAIPLYRQRSPRHPNLARSLTNIAWVKRLLSVQLQRKIDEELTRRKSAAPREDSGASRIPEERVELEHLRSEAFAELDEAEAIYSLTGNHRGCAAVRLNRGFLHLDNGEIDRAAEESAASWALAEEIHDYIPMARARILQCMVENARFEEQIEENMDLHRHAQRASDYAREALEIASRTQDRRILARAHVWQGLTWTNSFFNNPEAARECCDAATAILRQQGPEVMWDDLQDLRSRVLRTARVDTALREWSQGLIGSKSFQQMTEEFATIVIPRVWEREGRKVSRVAEKLSISPKKVRRVLQNAGLLRPPGDQKHG